VLTFRQVDVESPDARSALTRYYADRAAFMPWLPKELPFPRRAQFTRPTGEFVVGYFNDAVAACGGIRRLPDSPARLVRYEVKDVWVNSSIRGQGLGRKLMDDLEIRARELGCQEIVLDTHEVLEAAVKMYFALGYESVPRYNDNPHPTHWFSKVLG
jgi:GNAT superfamily N-acetyltransferase